MIDVASSGSDVPPATIVRPMMASDTPNCSATVLAPLTNKLLPTIKHPSPMIIKRILFHRACDFSVLESSVFPLRAICNV